jgi:hypothetical protein
MFLSLSDFASDLSRKKREQLATVLHHVTKATILNKANPNDGTRIPVPTTKQAIRTQITDGVNAVLPNLPHPGVTKPDANHAVALPSDCIADLLGHGLMDRNCMTNTLHKVTSLVESPIAKSLMEEDSKNGCRSVFLSIWSDDFEPNATKDNRGSVWICTLTVQTVTSGSPDMNHVYPIAVGPKGCDHQGALRTIFGDIKKLEQPTLFYNGVTRREERVSCHLICVVQDQPERRSLAGLMSGGKGYHGRWGWSFPVKEAWKKMVPCKECLTDLNSFTGDEFWAPRDCNKCFNFWAIPHNVFVPESGVRIDHPEQETVTITDSEGRKVKVITAVELTFEKLKAIVSHVHQLVVKSKYVYQVKPRSYLTKYCLNSHSQDEICDRSYNCEKIYKSKDPSLPEEERLAAEELQRLQPEKYSQWRHPAIWDSGLSIQQVTEPMMHLLFLNIFKNTALELHQWAAHRHKLTVLRSHLLKSSTILERLHLDWCKVLPYVGDKLGGWVSENYLGFARVAPWVYSYLDTLEGVNQTDEEIEEPEKEIEKWTIKECKDFLRCRRFPLGGKVEALRKRVKKNYHVEIPPPIHGGTHLVRRLLLLQWAMQSHLMGMRETTDGGVNIAERLIRLFLWARAQYEEDKHGPARPDPKSPWERKKRRINLDRARFGQTPRRWSDSSDSDSGSEVSDKEADDDANIVSNDEEEEVEVGYTGRGKVEELPKWVTQYNYQCLLNVPGQISMLGPIRNRWEGGFRGEGFLRLVKPLVYGRTNNWQSNLLLTIMRKKALKNVQSSLAETQTETTGNLHNLEGAYIYPTETAFHEDTIKEDIPLSLVWEAHPETKEVALFACVRQGSARKGLVPIKIIGEPSYQFGLWYHHIEFPKASSADTDLIQPGSCNVEGYCLLLPMQGGGNRYAVVTSHWLVMDQHREMVFPHQYLLGKELSDVL